MKIFKNIIKQYQFYFFFLFCSCFLLIFYFSTLSYLNNLSQNLNYVDVIPNAQTKNKKDNNEFHSFLADSHKNYGVYNLQSNNQITFNGNINHLLHYNMDNLPLKSWKNETINAQLILIKKNPNQTLENLTIETTTDSHITVETKFVDFINARKNRNNSFITPFDQHIADWIKTDTNQNYHWNKYQVLPVWITIKTDSEINAGDYDIKINVKQNNNIKFNHNIHLSIANYTLPELNNQPYYNLDLWQNFDRTISYYQQFEDQAITINNEKYEQYLGPYFSHLTSIGEQIFNFNIDQFLELKLINNQWNINFQADFNEDIINNYLKKILDYYGFKDISLSSYLLKYQDFKISIKDWNLTENQIKTGFDAYQKFLLDYFKKSNWYPNQRTKVFINFDELAPSVFEQALDDLNQLQGNDQVFAISTDVNYNFWSSKKTLEILRKVDRLSIAYSYLNFLDSNSYHKVIQLVNDREKAKKFTSIYSCTNDYPANFIKSQPGESAFIPLYGLKYNIHNFLRWSYNIWPESWLTSKGKITESDDINFELESGDLYSVYPLDENNQVGLSPRIQLLVYGQEQAIKLEILKEKYPEKVNAIINKIQAIYWPDNFKPNWNLFTRNHNKNTSVNDQLNFLITEVNKL